MSVVEVSKKTAEHLAATLHEHAKRLDRSGHRVLANEARLAANITDFLIRELNRHIEIDDRAFFEGRYRELPDIRPDTIKVFETPAYMFTLSNEKDPA